VWEHAVISAPAARDRCVPMNGTSEAGARRDSGTRGLRGMGELVTTSA
jgi:hypothetical protein